MKLTLKTSQPLGGNLNKYIFTADTSLSWQPGQYMHYVIAHDSPDDRGSERWFTISSAPHEGEVWITTRFFGDKSSSFKRALASLQPGQSVEADGIEGDFVVDDPNNKYIFIAGGIGITPFRSILNQLDFDGKPINVELLYANRDEADIPFKDELEALSARHEHFTITYFIGDHTIDESALKDVATRVEDGTFYISGPAPMVMALKTEVEQIGIPEARVKIDDFPGYETI
jgi:ferredoxin-NADP reductase